MRSPPKSGGRGRPALPQPPVLAIGADRGDGDTRPAVPAVTYGGSGVLYEYPPTPTPLVRRAQRQQRRSQAGYRPRIVEIDPSTDQTIQHTPAPPTVNRRSSVQSRVSVTSSVPSFSPGGVVTSTRLESPTPAGGGWRSSGGSTFVRPRTPQPRSRGAAATVPQSPAQTSGAAENSSSMTSSATWQTPVTRRQTTSASSSASSPDVSSAQNTRISVKSARIHSGLSASSSGSKNRGRTSAAKSQGRSANSSVAKRPSRSANSSAAKSQSRSTNSSPAAKGLNRSANSSAAKSQSRSVNSSSAKSQSRSGNSSATKSQSRSVNSSATKSQSRSGSSSPVKSQSRSANSYPAKSKSRSANSSATESRSHSAISSAAKSKNRSAKSSAAKNQSRTASSSAVKRQSRAPSGRASRGRAATRSRSPVRSPADEEELSEAEAVLLPSPRPQAEGQPGAESESEGEAEAEVSIESDTEEDVDFNDTNDVTFSPPVEHRQAPARGGRPSDAVHSRGGRPSDAVHSRGGRPSEAARSRGGRPSDAARSRDDRPSDAARSRDGRSSDAARSRGGRPSPSAGGLGREKSTRQSRETTAVVRCQAVRSSGVSRRSDHPALSEPSERQSTAGRGRGRGGQRSLEQSRRQTALRCNMTVQVAGRTRTIAADHREDVLETVRDLVSAAERRPLQCYGDVEKFSWDLDQCVTDLMDMKESGRQGAAKMLAAVKRVRNAAEELMQENKLELVTLQQQAAKAEKTRQEDEVLRAFLFQSGDE